MFDSETDWNRADLALLQHSAVSLFWQPRVLHEAQQALVDLSYDVATIHCVDGWRRLSLAVGVAA